MTDFKTDFDGTEETFPIPIKTEGRMFIYFLLNDEDEVLYVGQSAFPQSRVCTHRRSKKFTRYKFFECHPKKADELELKLYEKHKPPLNRIPPLDSNYSSLDNFKMKNKELRGKIKDIRTFLSENTVETRGGMYPIEYLERLKIEVA